ncbi:MAG TPA: MFS transporter [Streptosporangiaceae bacterium]|jgi:EmrB/QacA subfamily drug resistance transporter|nr:MFS transporter [Streptosporangiaceae bacterium]
MAETSAVREPSAGASPSIGRQGPMLVVLLSAWFMAQFDFFVVNVAAPSLQRELGAGPAALQLIVGGYIFAYAGGMITGGRLGDLYGYRRMFVGGMIAFTIASLLCGVAANPAQLVVARLVQGCTAAMMVPQVLAVITSVFPAETRPRALGWYGAAGGLGSIAGQVLGGLLVTADLFGLGWRIIFLINLPIGVVATVLAVRLLPRREPGRPARLDPLGAIGIATTLALLLVPLVLGHEEGWPAWTWICMAGALPAGAVTTAWQRRLGARGGQPILDMSLFKVGSYVAGIGAAAAFLAYFASFMFTLTLLLQDGLGLSALQAGLAFAPMGVLFSVTALAGSRLVDRYGLRVVVLGAGLTVTSLLLLALRLYVADADAGLAWIIALITLVGTGNGLVLPHLIGVALVRVRPHQAGVGSGILTTAQQFAGSAGIAIVGTVFFTVASPFPATADFTRAMTSSLLIDSGLLLVVIALVGYNARVSARLAAAEATAEATGASNRAR